MPDHTVQETDERLAYLESARRFFLEVWRDNPDLARHADLDIKALISPSEGRGPTLVPSNAVDSSSKLAIQTHIRKETP